MASNKEQTFINAAFNQAISFFDNSNKYPIDNDVFAMSTYWLADCYFRLSDYSNSIKLYNDYLDQSKFKHSIDKYEGEE